MKLKELRISNFKCFGPQVEKIFFDESTTFIIGPNGSGKTAILQVLARMFSINPSLRKIQQDDFHVPIDEEEKPSERYLFLEADFILSDDFGSIGEPDTMPPFFNHMRLSEDAVNLIVRYRLEASMGPDGDIEDCLYYVLGTDPDGTLKKKAVPRSERNYIAVHYLPAKRDPDDHIKSSTTSLLGRIIRSINWSRENDDFANQIRDLKELISSNMAIKSANSHLSKEWKKLHKGSHFQNANLVFGLQSLDKLRNQVSIEFNPAHGSPAIDYSFLSDGQKSLLYLSLVTSFIEVSRLTMRKVDSIDNADKHKFDVDKLNPPVFSIIGVEEPENSLSPHYLGRINSLIWQISQENDVQAVVTTHSASMLSRVEPQQIRFTRLGKDRSTHVKEISLPSESDQDVYKYIRQGIMSNPEIYFSRFVILGEGQSEAIVLPKLFEAANLPVDEYGICIALLGGRHVNHMWKILDDLGIPFATLIDLDLGRHQGGWGRVKYAFDELENIGVSNWNIENISRWDEGSPREEKLSGDDDETWINILRHENIFFSEPLDLDFSMILSYPTAYSVDSLNSEELDRAICKSVLGKSHAVDAIKWFTSNESKLFDTYYNLFKLHSKPATHLKALSQLDRRTIMKTLPEHYKKLIQCVRTELEKVYE